MNVCIRIIINIFIIIAGQFGLNVVALCFIFFSLSFGFAHPTAWIVFGQFGFGDGLLVVHWTDWAFGKYVPLIWNLRNHGLQNKRIRFISFCFQAGKLLICIDSLKMAQVSFDTLIHMRLISRSVIFWLACLKYFSRESIWHFSWQYCFLKFMFENTAPSSGSVLQFASNLRV